MSLSLGGGAEQRASVSNPYTLTITQNFTVSASIESSTRFTLNNVPFIYDREYYGGGGSSGGVQYTWYYGYYQSRHGMDTSAFDAATGLHPIVMGHCSRTLTALADGVQFEVNNQSYTGYNYLDFSVNGSGGLTLSKSEWIFAPEALIYTNPDTFYNYIKQFIPARFTDDPNYVTVTLNFHN